MTRCSKFIQIYWVLLSFIRLYCFIKIVLSCFFLVQLGITEVGRILNGLYCFSAAGKKKRNSDRFVVPVCWSLSRQRVVGACPCRFLSSRNADGRRAVHCCRSEIQKEKKTNNRRRGVSRVPLDRWLMALWRRPDGLVASLFFFRPAHRWSRTGP